MYIYMYMYIYLYVHAYLYVRVYLYGMATVSRIDSIISLFCRILSLLWGSFAKEPYNFVNNPTIRSHPITSTQWTRVLATLFARRSSCDDFRVTLFERGSCNKCIISVTPESRSTQVGVGEHLNLKQPENDMELSESTCIFVM